MKDPAYLFYSQDFYTGVATMNFEDRGKYISILCLMHQQLHLMRLLQRQARPDE